METHIEQIEKIQDVKYFGSVSAVLGLVVECAGINQILSIGTRCRVYGRGGNSRESSILAEVSGFKEDKALLLPYASLEGIGPGSRVEVLSSEPMIFPTEAWLGRVVNAFGDPIDDKGPLPLGKKGVAIKNSPPLASRRRRVSGKLNLGIKSINTFLTCCNGQRMGIFAGSGVGKSILMSMLARHAESDVNVIGLIGERGREVQEFVEDDLGEEGLQRTVLVVATSDEYALARRQAAYMTMAVAEYFRTQGKHVLCLMDSITRFAMAQREIGLSVGEPPTTKGYTPTVFSELPKLLERAGPGLQGEGAITGLFTVLVEGDDTNEPVSDTVRGILDGHIVLDREIAQRGRYPAINILRSVSRTMPGCNTEQENVLIQAARDVIMTYEDMAEMIRLGAYRKGSDPNVDRAIQLYPKIEEFLRQRKEEKVDFTTCYNGLAQTLGVKLG